MEGKILDIAKRIFQLHSVDHKGRVGGHPKADGQFNCLKGESTLIHL